MDLLRGLRPCTIQNSARQPQVSQITVALRAFHLERGRRASVYRVLVDRESAGVATHAAALDLLERDGADRRTAPLVDRRTALEEILPPGFSALVLSPTIYAHTWYDVRARKDAARERGVEGLMIKRRASAYGVGRKRGDWWKWKIEPYSIDAVLIYAQPGSGKRASLLTDYTFGLWHEGELVPVAKAYSGLTNDEIAEMDRWIRRHTVERFGPVRHVEPVQVFELGFEAVARSSRHRSGVAVRFPRMLRWRRDKQARDADTLDHLVRMAAPA